MRRRGHQVIPEQGMNEHLQSVTVDAPTRCAQTQEPMTFDGQRWVHEGACEYEGHTK